MCTTLVKVKCKSDLTHQKCLKVPEGTTYSTTACMYADVNVVVTITSGTC